MKISIVTINWNDVKGLDKTIQSVVQQSCPDIEYIVIDGGSTDGSVELIKKNSSFIHYWVSEKDGGIYDAMNKGTAQVTGDYCLYLNSGDFLYHKDVIAWFVEAASKSEEVDIFSCDILCTKNERHYNKVSSPNEITLEWYLTSAIFHPVTFIRTELVKNMPYRTDYKIISDWIFFFNQLILNNAKYKHLPFVSTIFDLNGVSATQKDSAVAERSRFLPTVLPQFVVDEFFNENVDNQMKIAKSVMNRSSYSLYRSLYRLVHLWDRYFIEKLNALRTCILIRFKSTSI